MKRIIAATVTVVALTIATTLAIAAPGPRSNPVPGDQTIVSGCVLRFPPEVTGQPRIHANGSHRCAGVKSVGIAKNGRLRVYQDTTDSQGYPILFPVAQVDETLASRGIIVGPSGGNAHTEYQFYDTKLGRNLNLKKRADRMRIAGKSSNLWLGWIHVSRDKE